MSRNFLKNETNRQEGKFQKLALHLSLLFLVLSLSQVIAQTPLNVSFSTTRPSCFGLPNGKVTAIVSGGMSPYNYMWSNGATGQMLNDVPAGSYTVTVTDNNGSSTTASVTLDQPPLIEADINASAQCSSPITLTAVGSGGTQPYKYYWTTGQKTEQISVSEGTYCVTITDDNSCGAVSCITVETEPLTLSVTPQPVTCPGGDDGRVTANPVGGTAPFTYTWSNGGSGQMLQNLQPGTYSVTVTDANGCTAMASATVSEPPPIAISFSTNQPACADDTNGSITAVVSGGNPPYTYLWNTGATTQTISDLGAGTYSVTVTDKKGCEASKTIVLEPLSELEITVSGTDETCPDENDGSVTVMTAGGVSPITYAWSNGANTASLNNLAPGTYSVTVTDGAGCQATGSYTVTEATDLDISITGTDTNVCIAGDGSATVNITSGVAPYTFAWSNGANTQTINDLNNGTYTVTVTDNRGCTAVESVTISEPPMLAVNVSATDMLCPGATDGEATANVTGGTAPFTYAWSNGGNTQTISNLGAGEYTVTVTDANGCEATDIVMIMEAPEFMFDISADDVVCGENGTTNATAQIMGGVPPYSFLWNNGAMTQTIIGLTPGSYSVTVTDALGCQVSGDLTVTAIVLDANITSQDVLCFGENTGTATVNVTGGTEPYSYNWSNGETTQTISDLVAGTYTVTATDANDCEIIESIEITEPSDISITFDASELVCVGESDGSITANVTGGTQPYEYLWSNGETTQTITDLEAGTYTVTVTDANDCEAVASVTITEAQGPMLEIEATEIVCGPENTGNATVNVTGGVPPYSYMWSTGSDNPVIEDLTTGTYSVTVTDANGCSATAETTINVISDFSISVVPRDVLCHGDNSGSILVMAQGGSEPYTYAWSNGASGEEIVNLIAGTYTVTVTDANNCSVTESITINEPDDLIATTSGTNVTCFDANDGTAIVNVTGGTMPYSYEWSNGETTAEITNLMPGTYTVTVTDANFCETTASIEITQPNQLGATINATNVDCFGNSTGSATANVSGGTAPFTYAWSNGESTQTISNLPAGNYTVTITDVNECSATTSVEITEPDELMVNLTVNNIVCTSDQVGSITAVVTGGTAPYEYLWSNGETTATIANLPSGTYTVTITDANDCTTEATAGVAQIPNLELEVTKTDVTCFGANDGTATVVASGDTPPYTYNWSNGATTDVITGLAPGMYTVTVTGTAGCIGEASVTIEEPTELNVQTLQTDITCNGGSDGEASVVVTGGTAPYSYTWSNGGSTATITGLTAGTYDVTVTDANECSISASVTITEPSALEVTLNVNQGTCEGSNDGVLTANATGGNGNYTYNWSNGESGSTIDNLDADTYTVTVTDENNCTAEASITLAAFEAPTCEAIVLQEESVPGANDGSATVEVTGGAQPYEYRWSTGADTETITGLGVGTFSVTVTDANGCMTSCEVELRAPAQIGDFVWNDLDRDGIQDPGEPGISDVIVIVTGVAEDENYADTTTTDENGIYGFDVPPPGNYKLTFILPAGSDLTATTQNAGSDDALDSDVDPEMLMTDVFFIQRGDVDLTLDAGFYDLCVNLTNPGIIGYDQYLCGPGNDPAPIVEISEPVGGEGEIEYLWMRSTVGGPFNDRFWEPIPDSNTKDYDPGPIFETTYYIRCTRRENCPYLETNIVTVVVGNETVAEINGSPTVCEDSPVTFFATDQGGSSSSYQWDFGDRAIPRYVTGKTATTTFNNFGISHITLTVSAGGCTSTTRKRISVLRTCSGLALNADAVSESEVLVKWSVPEDGQYYFFSVEHSADGENFNEIARVGSPVRVEDRIRYYEYMDKEPKTGRNYYRVRAVDNDQRETVSEVADAIIYADSKLMHFYPNPVSDRMTLEIFESFNDDVQLQVINTSGITVQTIEVPEGADRQEIDFSNLPAGTYFVKVRYGKVDVKVLKVLKR